MIRSIAFLAVLCAPLRADQPLPDGAVARLEKLRTFVSRGQIEFTPDGKQVVAATKGRAFAWDAATGKLLREFACANETVLLLAPLPDGTLFTLDSRGTARWNDLRSGERVAIRDLGRDLSAPGKPSVSALGWHTDPARASALLFVRDNLHGNPNNESTRLFRLDLDGGRLELIHESAGVHLILGTSPNLYLRTEGRSTLNDAVRMYMNPAEARVFVAAKETGRPLFDLRH